MQSTILNDYLNETIKHNATDLHICVGTNPLMRVNSLLMKIPGTHTMSVDDVTQIVTNSLDEKMMAVLEKKKVIDFSYSRRGFGRFRCNIYKQRGTFAIAIRMLPLEIPDFSSLGLPETILRFTNKTRGLVLFTGTTGCGKSTTLASPDQCHEQRTQLSYTHH